MKDPLLQRIYVFYIFAVFVVVVFLSFSTSYLHSSTKFRCIII